MKELHVKTNRKSGRNARFTLWHYVNPCPAEPGYTLPLQTVQI